MAVHEVVTWGDPRLKKDSEDVGAWTPELDQLVVDMFETALVEEGVGLAAPQIGINLNLAVIDCSCGEDPAQKIVLINPEIVREEGLQVGPEGCLSIPGIREVLERPMKVWVKNRRPDGSWEEITGEELLARAFCHEIDHLRGRLFVEYFGPVKRQVIQRKYQKHYQPA
ncbi:MAG TPA: peptide deformylase [Holophagaceae bacterium]|jgi:peptide deformylase|nr:peptide deformylase [Holophagaceae bacterium]